MHQAMQPFRNKELVLSILSNLIAVYSHWQVVWSSWNLNAMAVPWAPRLTFIPTGWNHCDPQHVFLAAYYHIVYSLRQ